MASATPLGEEPWAGYTRLPAIYPPLTRAASLNLAHDYLSVGCQNNAARVLKETIGRRCAPLGALFHACVPERGGSVVV
jgi:hypothetical protein